MQTMIITVYTMLCRMKICLSLSQIKVHHSNLKICANSTMSQLTMAVYYMPPSQNLCLLLASVCGVAKLNFPGPDKIKPDKVSQLNGSVAVLTILFAYIVTTCYGAG